MNGPNSIKHISATGWPYLLAVIVACGCGELSRLSPSNDRGVKDAAYQDITGLNNNDTQPDSEHDPFGPPWDPVWHLTEPKHWPKAPPARFELCHPPACRIALDVSPMHPSHLRFQDSTFGLTAVNVYKKWLFFRAWKDAQTSIIARGEVEKGGWVEAYLYDKFLSVLFVHEQNRGGDVQVYNVVTGEMKVAFRYLRTPQNESTVSETLINENYVFWDYSDHGLMSRNLKTGQVRWLGRPSCENMCAVADGVICFSSPISLIDQQTGRETAIAGNLALQVDGACSHDRRELVWIDYRDPPGQNSYFWGYRNGGEVYTKDLKTGIVTRITHDSPKNPRAKAYPAIGKELIVWKQAPVRDEQNPDESQLLYSLMWDIIVLDRKTGKRCRIHSDLAKIMIRLLVIGRRVYGEHDYVVGLDIDDPAIGCIPE